MPIIDPSLQLALCTNDNDNIEDNNFFIYYLYHASQNISRTLDSMQAYFQFEDDLKKSKQLLTQLFKLNGNFEADFNNPAIQNYYEYLYEKFPKDEQHKISEIQRGQYFSYKNDRQIGDKTIKANFFRPDLSKSLFHSWYFTDSPVAILCVDLQSKKKTMIDKIELDLIDLEIDLISAAGFTLVLSIITDSKSIKESKSKKALETGKSIKESPSIQSTFIEKNVKNHTFSEIHLNFSSNEEEKTPKSKLNDKSKKENESEEDFCFYVLRKLTKTIDHITGQFYIYSPYFKDFKSTSDACLKKLKNKPRIHVFNFSDDIKVALNLGQLIGSNNSEYKCQPFPYFKSGFDYDKMRIMLCNVPVYSIQNCDFNTMPSERSYLSWAYISRDDFNSWSGTRVKITLDDSSDTHNFLERYVNEDDIYSINPQFFVTDTLYLTRTDRQTLKTVSTIQEESKDKTLTNESKEYEQESSFQKIKDIFMKKEIIESKLINATYAFQCQNRNTFLYKSQIFTAYEACRTCLINDKEFADQGFIYQVETGEGKSFIISLISATLSSIKKKKTIHVASSNIQLAIRDYIDSFDFFHLLNLRSAILLHQNELPSDKDLGFPEEKRNEMKARIFPDELYGQKLFDNSSNMNYSVCGNINVNNDDDKTATQKVEKIDIVFSTFVNFEGYYLRMMETCPSRVNDLFSNCYLLIDEADSILIDELSNGTILSRSMKTNCQPILKFVYEELWLKKRKTMDVYEEVKRKWPKCRDLKHNDIENMLEEIKLVNQEEFINGKKYSIETEKITVKRQDPISQVKEAKEKFGEFINKTGEKIKNKIKNKIKKSKKKEDEEITESVESISLDDTESNIQLTSPNSTESNIQLTSANSTEIELSSYIDNEIAKEEEEEINENDKKHHKKHKKHHSKRHKKEQKNYRNYKYIVPFDYDHKGVLEPNKEFSGFVQQFIAIKEMINNKNNKNMKIKDVSMNYLYVSHPIFVKLYKKVCGFTGTLGNKFDKEILKKQYKLVTKKIPRNRPNRRIELPVVLCSDIKDRNLKIVNEVLEFHEKEFPILVIFQDLNEISDVYEMLIARGIEYINIFDGKEKKVKPDKIAGRKGAVSLGTNVCGRGTDIKEPEKPLHVIVSYFTSNSRVMQQAFGRTSRQGRDGTVSIICLKEQYLSPMEILETESMKNVLQDFQVKNEMQKEFIDSFRNVRSWIFDTKIGKQNVDFYIKKMRASKVNVNRVVACNYEFPICMSVQTFLIIQSQKIYSLYNCPNCKYTWMLFQQYIREMILESWSLFIDKADKKFNLEKPDLTYKDFLKQEIKTIEPWLEMYLPKYQKKEIVSTFMNIFDIVTKYGENKIKSVFPEKVSKFFDRGTKDNFIAFNIGFRPYSLIDESGARINIINGKDQKQNYIIDPELKYQLRNDKSIKVSITRKIDGIFEMICSKINEMLGSYTGLKLFLRRTLSGCEFGVCFDFDLENTNETVKNDSNCLIDLDPLFLFTIILKSVAPLLAGILIIGLVYIASIAKKIVDYITLNPITITGEVIKKTLKEVLKTVATQIAKSQIEKFCDKIINYLLTVLNKQIISLRKYNCEMVGLFEVMLRILSVKELNKADDELKNLFTDKICNVKMKPGFARDFLPCGLPIGHLLKIGLLLMLCFASFMMNFDKKRKELKYEEKKSAENFDKNQKVEKSMEDNEKVVQNEDFVNIELKNE